MADYVINSAPGEFIIRGYTEGQEWSRTTLRYQKRVGFRGNNPFYVDADDRVVPIEAHRELELEEQDIIDITEIVLRSGIL